MPTTPRGERTKKAFLDAAKRVFAEKGYFNAKITDISTAAGRSPGSFYNYYENKESLLEDLAADFIDEVLGRAKHVHRGVLTRAVLVFDAGLISSSRKIRLVILRRAAGGGPDVTLMSPGLSPSKQTRRTW